MPRLFLLAVLVLAGCRTAAPPATPAAEPVPLVLVSIDGFRYDYRDRAETPALDRLAAEGVHAGRLIPVFPSLTFPNHYSLVTGLHPEHHGIVGNSMRDAVLGSFSLGNRDAVTDARWWGGEPLWATAERQGARSATMFWPGSEAAIGGVRPSDWKIYDESVSADARVDTVLAWLTRPAATRPRVVTLYFEEVDHAGHSDGPDAPETVVAIQHVDAAIARLTSGLDALGRPVNLVVVSDHGMAALSPERVVYLDDAAPRFAAQTENVLWGATTLVWPQPGRLDSLALALDALDHVEVYRRDAPEAAGGVPERLHFRDNQRIAPLVLVADEGWTLTTRTNTRTPRGGTHGYDNTAPSMAGILIARGPAFRSGGAVVPEFRTVDVYAMLCEALGIVPAPNDGDPTAARGVLADQ
ncbi:MAG TPA: ectonucleotide pyrophosphatase/phosphodiesterase [Rubricoccaceae bacterium]